MNAVEIASKLMSMGSELKTIGCTIEKSTNEVGLDKRTIALGTLAGILNMHPNHEPEEIVKTAIETIADLKSDIKILQGDIDYEIHARKKASEATHRFMRNLGDDSRDIEESLERIENKFRMLEDSNARLAKQNDMLNQSVITLKRERDCAVKSGAFYKEIYNECIEALNNIFYEVYGTRNQMTSRYERENLVVAVHNLTSIVKDKKRSE